MLEGSVLALVRGTFYEALAVHDFEKSNVELKYSTFSLFLYCLLEELSEVSKISSLVKVGHNSRVRGI